MDAVNLGLSALATISILAVVPLLSLLQQRLVGRPMTGLWPGVGMASGVGSLVTLAIVWITGFTGISALLAPPFVALGALFAVIATSPIRQRSLFAQAVFSGVMAALVFTPVFMAFAGVAFQFLFTKVGLLDFGAALPVFVAAGGAGLGVYALEHGGPVEAAGRIRWWPLTWVLLLLWVAWIGWLVGIELAIDESTGIIVSNAVLMPIAGAVAGVVIERVRHRANTPRGLAVGFLGGAMAATASCAFLDTGFAVMTALVAGAVSVVLSPSAESAGSKSILATAVIASGTGLLLLGLFATNLAAVYTGQPEVFFGQLGAVVGFGVYAFLVGAGLWLLLRGQDKRWDTRSRW